MKTISFVSSKGGVGKTTLAFNIAVEAAKTGTVYLVDMDPALALTRFAQKRLTHQNADNGVLDISENPMLLSEVNSIPEAIQRLKDSGFERDYLIVDTPNAFAAVIRDAIAPADCVVLPLEASPVDVLVNEDAVRYVAEAGKRDRSLFVLNPVDRRGKDGEATIPLIAHLSPHKPFQVPLLRDFKMSLVDGRAAGEVNATAGVEIGKLWKQIQGILGHEIKVNKRAHARASRRS